MLKLRMRGDVWYCGGTVKRGKSSIKIKEHSTGRRNKPDAELYAAEEERRALEELTFGPGVKSRHRTIDEALKLYLARPGGLGRGEIRYVQELARLTANFPIADAKAAWRIFKEQRCGGLAPATVNRHGDVLRAALNYAADEWEIPVPKIPRERKRPPRQCYLSRPDADRLEASYAPHVQPIIRMLRYQGCRTQEALQLRFEAVDFRHNRITFDRTKNGEPRRVAMHEIVRRDLEAIAAACETIDSGHVFLNSRGDPYADTRDYRYPGGNPLSGPHRTALRRAKVCPVGNVEGFRIHDWRHHWASWCVMSGVDLITLKELGGWKSLDMVQRYSSLSGDHMDEAMAKIR